MRFVRFAVLVLLGFLALSALAGSIPMLVQPEGSAQMPLSLLGHSPFHSFLIPAIVLLVSNGLLAVWVFWRAVTCRPDYGNWVIAQGCVLLGWLVVECWMLRMVVWLHYLYGAIAVALILLGILLCLLRPDASAQG